MRYLIITMFCFLGFFTPAHAQEAVEQSQTSGMYNGDVEKGRVVFFRCQACHNITASPSDNSKLGPNLYGIFGKQVANDETFANYSKALIDAEFVWDEEKLDNWLKNPNVFLPGNTMAFSGVMRHVDRVNLINFIREQREKP